MPQREWRIDVETAPTPWITALRNSHETLRAAVEPLDDELLERRSYDADWSIAQVLSHLGSQSEIFGLFLDAGLSGQDPPGGEVFQPIWDTWNARSAHEQAIHALQVDGNLVGRFESLDDEQREHVHLQLFGMELGTTGLARMRLSEHAIHTWDVVVALQPSATVAADAVDLLVDTLDALVGRCGKPGGHPRKLGVTTTRPERHFILDIGDTVALLSGEPDASGAHLRLPAEAFVRLVYGRLDPDHTPPVETGGDELDALRKVFPGL